MNTFNRILIVFACLVAILGLTAVFILPRMVLPALSEWLAGAAKYVEAMPSLARIAIGAGLALVVDLLLVLLIIAEVKPGRKRYIRVEQVTGGMVTLNVESVVQQLQNRLDALAGVVKVKPTIQTKGDKVHATVDVEVTAAANVPTMASQLTSTVQNTLTGDLGVQVHGVPEVRIRVTPTPTGTIKAVSPPVPAEAPVRLPAAPASVAPTPPPLPPAEAQSGEGEQV